MRSISSGRRSKKSGPASSRIRVFAAWHSILAGGETGNQLGNSVSWACCSRVFFGVHQWSFLGVGADDDEVIEARRGLSRLVLHCSRRRERKN